MALRPVNLMRERVNRARSDSDVTFFWDLIYAGEFAVRLTTSAIVAAIDDDLDRHRYRLLHSLVRSIGIGEWSQTLDHALIGSASKYLVSAAQEDRRILTKRLGPGNWQYEAVRLLSEVQLAIEPDRQQMPTKVPLRSWFTYFVELRNKTRGHGAPTLALCSKVLPQLEESIQLICDKNPLFHRPWAYVHRQMSGKYRVISLGGDESAFAHLKTLPADSQTSHPDGVYVQFDVPRRVELIRTNADVSDFFFPNGGFNGKRFEFHSLITDERLEGKVSQDMMVGAGGLPASETHGVGQLEVVGNVWSNLPSAPIGYIQRPKLEDEITEKLTNDRHPIVTLVGRGGIGKTSLALQILHNVASSDRFEAIVWFSARDIDLLPEGPKDVRPQILTQKDISDEFVTLLSLKSEVRPDRTTVDVMSDSLRKSQHGPILFVFDNFETISKPADVFKWVDTNIRLPNKTLITTRYREFKADYPIAIDGMGAAEANKLISQTAAALGIDDLITDTYRLGLLDESNGHPYVIKIILGEVADIGKLGRPRHIMGGKDDVLDALFERTFANLSLLARRVFLTLSGWRSLVPQLVLEAIVLRDQSEQLDTGGAIDQLVRMSLVQHAQASDGVEFLDTPLAAAIFGARKLAVSPDKLTIDNDIRLLRYLGPSNVDTLKSGGHPRITKFFMRISSLISDGKFQLEEVLVVLEFIARNYPPAWLLLADLHDELQSSAAIEYVRRYIENVPDGAQARDAWARLVDLYRRSENLMGACGAFVRAYDGYDDDDDVPFAEIANMANWMLNKNRIEVADMNVTDKKAVLISIAGLMERRIEEASATDLFKLAWLHLHSRNITRSRQVAKMGLEKEPGNRHCQRLVARLSSQLQH